MSKIFIGKVSSDKPNKTIVVVIQTRKTHPIYKKQYTTSKKLFVHDEKNQAKVGDLVSIKETRPISATKRFMLDKILEKATIDKEEINQLDVQETDK